MKILNWLKNNPIRSMFLIPIFLVAGISISHVVSWYDIANPFQWAIYLSIAIEIGAITALIAATNRIQGGVWFMFGLVTFIQMVGNIFYCFKEIDPNGDLFIAWVELTSPVWELMGTEETDIVGLKRWLAFLEGGLLPIISLTSLHFFVKYEKPDDVEDMETLIDQLVTWADITRTSYNESVLSDLITTRRLVFIMKAYSIFGNIQKSIELNLNRFDDVTKMSFMDLFKKVSAIEDMSEEDIVKEEESQTEASFDLDKLNH